jgi:hypothetical protein
MGNKASCNEKETKCNSREGILKSIKEYLNKERKCEFKKIQEIASRPKSVVERKSVLQTLLKSSEIALLSQDILTFFSNKEVAKVNNENLYVSLLMQNLFEPVNENRLNSSNNVNMSIVQNNWPMYFTTSTVDKINEIFNLNNDLNTSEKHNKYKMTMNSINSTHRDLLGLSLHNLNMSRDSHLETEGQNNNVSRMNTKKSRLTVFTRKSTREANDDDRMSLQNNRPAKSLSNKSLRLVSIQNENEIFKKKGSLNQIKEFEVELQDENHEQSTGRSFRSSQDQLRNFLKPNLKLNKNKSVDSRQAKKLSYSLALRKKFSKKIIPYKEKKTSSRSPFDLFSEKVIEHFKNEEKAVKEDKSKLKHVKNNIYVKNLKNKKKEKKPDLHFSINLKSMIKQEIKENVIEGRLKYDKSNERNYSRHQLKGKKEIMNSQNCMNFNSVNSTLFKDSIDKYIHFEKLETGKKKKKDIKEKKVNGKVSPSLTLLSQISLSDLEEKEKQQDSVDMENSQETISKNLALLKKQ